MIAIFKRELKSYFYTPTAYVFLGALLVFFGWFFLMNNVLTRDSGMGMPEPSSANFATTLDTMILILLFLIPILVMKLISEERRQKTDQLLHTVPISTFEIVIAKFLSAWFVYAVGVIISLVYPLLLFFFAGSSLKYLIAAYLGFLLLGGSFIAICLFASAITESQIVAGMMGFLFILSLWLVEFLSNFFSSETAEKIFDLFSLIAKFSEFKVGIIRLAPVFYYIGIMIIFLFLTIRAVDKRRWTER